MDTPFELSCPPWCRKGQEGFRLSLGYYTGILFERRTIVRTWRGPTGRSFRGALVADFPHNQLPCLAPLFDGRKSVTSFLVEVEMPTQKEVSTGAVPASALLSPGGGKRTPQAVAVILAGGWNSSAIRSCTPTPPTWRTSCCEPRGWGQTKVVA